MDLNALCAVGLQSHFANMNLACSVASEALSAPDLGMDVVACEAQRINGGVSVVFDARVHNSSARGIRILSVGLGNTEETASIDAASQWALGVLPVIVSYVRRSHVCEVQKLPMIVAVVDSQERYGWTAYLGPVIARAYGGSASDESLLGDLSQSNAYIPIFRVVHPRAAHRKVMWVESFASKFYAEAKVEATCRLRNDDFPEGREALLAWAKGWPPTGAALLSKRQFILFEPASIEEIESSNPSLMKKFDHATKPSVQ